MDADLVDGLWRNYRSVEIDKTIAEDDDMFKKSANGWKDYELVGESAAKVVVSALFNVRGQNVDNILDFGCGHGRVARYLRAMFPQAKLFFSDIDKTAWEFCATTFDGVGFQSEQDFSKITVPGDMDLIWVGSVFTHIDYGRMITLWDKLFSALRPGGMLIATFRGPTMYDLMLKKPEPYYDNMIQQYRAVGVGYQDYKGFVNWGQSLVSVARCVALGSRDPRARLVGYTEAGWANIQDVAVWTKV